MLEEDALIMPRDFFVGFQQWHKAETFQFTLDFFGNLHASHLAKRGEHIEMCGEIVHAMRGPFTGPTPEGESAGTALPDRGFAATHVGIGRGG